jgi:hypothetical protein
MQRNQRHADSGLFNGQLSTTTGRTKIRIDKLLSFGTGLIAMMGLLLFLPAVQAQTTA